MRPAPALTPLAVLLTITVGCHHAETRETSVTTGLLPGIGAEGPRSGVFHTMFAELLLRDVGVDRDVLHVEHLPMSINRLVVTAASEREDVAPLEIRFANFTADTWTLEQPSQAAIDAWLVASAPTASRT